MIVYVVIGFFAQLIDGTMGMGYGVSSRTGLKVFAGTDAITAGVAVSCSEVATAFVSGVSHYKLKNYTKELFVKLLMPGMVGGLLGSFVLIEWGTQLEIFINLYLIIMGVRILFKAIYFKRKRKEVKGLPLLGFIGGFLDATGGGGWGPVVTSSLVMSKKDAKKVIGSVNIAEFFVTLVQVAMFIAFIEDFRLYIDMILSLILGGVIAAPLGAVLCKKVPIRFLLVLMGILLIVLNVYTLSNYL